MEPLEERVVRLEELVTHGERVTAELNEIIIAQHQKIEAMEAKLARFEYRMSSLSERIDQPQSPENEKPPHY